MQNKPIEWQHKGDAIYISKKKNNWHVMVNKKSFFNHEDISVAYEYMLKIIKEISNKRNEEGNR